MLVFGLSVSLRIIVILGPGSRVVTARFAALFAVAICGIKGSSVSFSRAIWAVRFSEAVVDREAGLASVVLRE